jgi:hypothetical protein
MALYQRWFGPLGLTVTDLGWTAGSTVVIAGSPGRVLGHMAASRHRLTSGHMSPLATTVVDALPGRSRGANCAGSGRAENGRSLHSAFVTSTLRPRRDVAIVGLLIGTLLGPWGCSTNSHRITPLSEQVRADVGTLGVATSSIVPASDLVAATGGKGSGAAKGAAAGALGMAEASLRSGHPLTALIGLGLTPIAAVAGGVYGAVIAESAEKAKEAGTALARAFVDLKAQEVIHDHVLQTARDRLGHPVVSLRETRDVDTILEVSMPSVRLVGASALDIDPPLHLVVLACPRLVRRKDDLQLYPTESTTPSAVVHMSAPRKFLDWGSEDARLFREEMERAYQNLAEKVVEDMFMVLHPPGPRWQFGGRAPRFACPRADGERKR